MVTSSHPIVQQRRVQWSATNLCPRPVWLALLSTFTALRYLLVYGKISILCSNRVTVISRLVSATRLPFPTGMNESQIPRFISEASIGHRMAFNREDRQTGDRSCYCLARLSSVSHCGVFHAGLPRTTILNLSLYMMSVRSKVA